MSRPQPARVRCMDAAEVDSEYLADPDHYLRNHPDATSALTDLWADVEAEAVYQERVFGRRQARSKPRRGLLRRNQ